MDFIKILKLKWNNFIDINTEVYLIIIKKESPTFTSDVDISLFFYFIIKSNNFLAAFLGPSFSCPSTPKEVLICPTFTPVSKNSLKYCYL